MMTEGRMGAAGVEGKGDMGSCCLKGTDFQFCKMNRFWRRLMVMVA